MNKNLIYGILLAAVGTLGTTSCGDPSTEGVTQITYYAKLTLNGDAAMTVNKGETFVDPGCTAVMRGEDVSDQVVASGHVDTSKSGVYTVDYSVTNADGFVASTSRTVYVYDTANAREGFFHSTADSYRDYGGKQTPFGGNYEVFVADNGDGTYDFSDLLGGWYEQRAGYGSKYAMTGTVAIADDGTMSLVTSLIAGWGDSLVDFAGTFDASTGSYKLTSTYVSSMVFNITLTK